MESDPNIVLTLLTTGAGAACPPEGSAPGHGAGQQSPDPSAGAAATGDDGPRPAAPDEGYFEALSPTANARGFPLPPAGAPPPGSLIQRLETVSRPDTEPSMVPPLGQPDIERPSARFRTASSLLIGPAANGPLPKPKYRLGTPGHAPGIPEDAGRHGIDNLVADISTDVLVGGKGCTAAADIARKYRLQRSGRPADPYQRVWPLVPPGAGTRGRRSTVGAD